MTTRGSALRRASAEHPHDAVLLDADARATTRRCARLLEEDPRAQMIVLGDPSGADAVRGGARAPAPIDHLPEGGARRGHARARRPLRRRPPALGRAAPARRAARRAHRAARTARCSSTGSSSRCGARAGAAGRRRARCCSSTSTASRSSTTRSATRPATSCCSAVARAARRARCAPATRSRGWAATSSPCCSRTSTDPREATVVAERVLATLAEPFPVAGRELHVSGSIGIALGGAGRRPGGADPRRRRRDVPRQGGGQGAPRGVRRADAPPRARPPRPRDRPAARDRARGRCRCSTSRSCAPATGELAGFEALCRWEVEPRRVRRRRRGDGADRAARALRAARGGQARGASGACRSRVNVSARQLADPDFAARRRGRADRASGARPGDLRLEVTESAMAQDPEAALRTLADLRTRLGVGAHLDDFGTGASSLRLPAPLPRRRAEDRPLARDRHAHRRRLARDRQGDRRRSRTTSGWRSSARASSPPRTWSALAALGCEPVQGFHLSRAAHRGGGGAPAHGARRRRDGARRRRCSRSR